VPRKGDALLTVTRGGEPLPESVWRAMDVPKVTVRDKNYGFTVTRGDEPSTFLLTPTDFEGNLKEPKEFGNRWVDISGTADIDGKQETGDYEARVSFQSDNWCIRNRWLLWLLAILAALAILFVVSTQIKLLPRRILTLQPCNDYYKDHMNKTVAKAKGFNIPTPIAQTKFFSRTATVTVRAPQVAGANAGNLRASITMTVKKVNWWRTKSSKRHLVLVSARVSTGSNKTSVDINGALELVGGVYKPARAIVIKNQTQINISNEYMRFTPILVFK
jgi:hypothetical protein